MRKVIVCNIVSLDGYYEGEGGDFAALNMDDAFDLHNLERMREAGTVLLGRNGFEMFSSYWPAIADAPEDPGNRAFSEVNRELSRTFDPLPKVVVSDSYVVPADNPWRDVSTVIPIAETATWLEEHRATGDGDIVVYGSRTMWNGLLAQGLVDELHLMVSPTVLTAGTRLFDHPAALELLGVRQFEGSGNVVLRYAVLRP